MRIPSKLKIQGHIFDVIKHKGNDTGNSNCGTTRPFQSKIWISNDLPDSQKESTLLHEIIEVINDFGELNLEHSKIQTLESMLYQVFKDNNLLGK